MSLDTNAVQFVTENTDLNSRNIVATCELLFGQDCTIPFIARYRKEVTGNMDEVQIQLIKDTYEQYQEREKRREFILDAIKKMEKLTPALEKQIKAATTLAILEDLYAPYKSKRKTKAMIAKEKGLEPLADWILTSNVHISDEMENISKNYVSDEKGIKNAQEAIDGACDILIESFAHHIETKETLRDIFWKEGVIKTSKRKDAEKIAEHLKFKDFFEFEEKVSQIRNPKNTHRFMAMRRGMSLKVLKIEVLIDSDTAYNIIEQNHFSSSAANYELLQKIAKKSYDSYISSSLDLEVKGELKKLSDEAAIGVFGVNLKNLLLQPYLGSKAVLGIDPGIRTGCKIVVIDHTGKFVGDHVIYPFAPKNDVQGSKLVLSKLIEAFNIEYIAIGNGTNGRESLDFVETHLEAVKEGKVKATMISESGASIYSASEIARKEFPDKDVTVRGAISIARRFQDPLAELVKIDPKSIGVGQYQHDVNQAKLKKTLESVVENCVNYVGVDLNTASAPLLSYVSGVGPTVAANIVKERDKKGKFTSREELLGVSRFTQKVFEQSAGFLRIYNGDNPLDATFIHPERYDVLNNWCKEKSITLKSLVEDTDIIKMLTSDSALAQSLGAHTFKDILSSLSAPKQDPRSEFKSVEFRKDVKSITDLKVGQWYTGVVNNITNFGAFVDIGVKESGLLHISQMADRFVENAMDVFKVGDQVKVRVTDVDHSRKRIALSCKSDDGQDAPIPGQSSPRKSKGRQQDQSSGFKNSAFAGLSGLKLK